MPQLAIYLFGSPRLELDKQPVEFSLRKGVALLAFLAVEGGRQNRDRLATLLWPGYGQRDARANLRRTLSALSRALPGAWLWTTPQSIELNPEANIWIDIQCFRELAKQAGAPQAQAEATALAGGPFLAGFTLNDAPEFDQWQSQESQYWSRQVGQLLERLIRYHIDQQTWEDGIPFAQRWVALEPLHEEARRLLMLLYARSGQRNAALDQYLECVRILQAELSVAPEEATTQFYHQIRSGLLGELRHWPTPSSDTPSPAILLDERQEVEATPLPLHTTPFLGRETEMDQLRHALLHETECRLLTLLGPGGSGKTRLALAAAEGLAPHFADGIFFVPLAGLETAVRLESTVANALGFSFYTGSTPRKQLCRYLADKSILLILDNYEHLLDGVDLPPTLLAAAPRLKILITSRERLGLQEEWLLEVNGLPYPQVVGAPHGESLEGLEAFAAVALFVERARRSRANFALTAEHAPYVLRICQLTAGMPLSLELAATWVRLMTPREIAHQISADLDFLQSNLRNLPRRHRSLRAVFDHSWRLLSEEEQRIFIRLAIFRGGFRADAAREVADASPALLLNLADKSLIMWDDTGRFTIHELLRQYAHEQLVAQPAIQQATEIRFQDYMARFLAQRQAHLISGNQPQTLNEIEPELDNILHAWPFLYPGVDYVTATNAFASLLWYMEIRSQHQEFVGLFGQLHALPESERPHFTQMTAAGFLMLTAMDLRMWSVALLRLGQIDRARQAANHSLDVMAPLSGQPLCNRPLNLSDADVSASYACQWAWNLLLLNMLEVSSGNYHKAQEYCTTAAQQFQAIGYVLGQSVAQRGLGEISRSLGAYTQARVYFEASLKSVAVLRNPATYHAAILDNLGRLDLWLGNYESALKRVQTALDLRRLTRDPALTAASLRHLGQIYMAVGSYDLAAAAFAESLSLLERLGNRRQTASTHFQMGLLAFHSKQLAQALELLLAARLAFEELNYHQGMALTALDLGATHLANDQVAQAVQAIEEGVHICTTLRSSWLRGRAECTLGRLRYRQGETTEAVRHFRDALIVVRGADAIPIILEILVSSLQVLSVHNRAEIVQELAHLAAERPEATFQTRTQVQDYLRQQAGVIPLPQIGKPRPLADIVNDVIQQLEQIMS